MHRILKNKTKQGGFTLIELMIVVAIIGILAAVAIPQFLDMMKKSKRGEAELSLDAMKKSNKAGWAERAGFIPSDGALAPTTGDGSGCCNNSGDRKCPVSADDWSDEAGWADLDFRIDQPNYFQYEYAGADDEFTATAVGDLDCDGTAVTYTLEGSRDTAGGPAFALTKPAYVD